MIIAALIAATLLAIERVTYVLVWRQPARFVRLCESGRILGCRDPVEALSLLFFIFKLIQISVFVAWIIGFGGTVLPPPTAPPLVAWIAVLLLTFGQLLNLSVFWRLGKEGVFYGNRLGRKVPWIDGFPFSLVPHPQYVGTLVFIWGLFGLMRFPEPDWIILPLISTVYYILAIRLER